MAYDVGNFLAQMLLGGLEETQRRREKKEQFSEEVQKAILAERIKGQFDPESQAKRQAFELINLLNPEPTLAISSTAPPEARQRLQQRFQEAKLGAGQRKMKDLLGLLSPRTTQAGGLTQVFGVNPSTGEIEPLGEVPKGSKTFLTGEQPVVSINPYTGEQIESGTVPRGARVVTQPSLPLEKGTAIQSAKTAIRQIDNIRNLVLSEHGGDPKLFFSFGLPGIKGSRNLAKSFDRLKLEIVTARGGKQLTPSEQVLVTTIHVQLLSQDLLQTC